MIWIQINRLNCMSYVFTWWAMGSSCPSEASVDAGAARIGSVSSAAAAAAAAAAEAISLFVV
jgi:hypothetical protein